jgi:hypothetical protein
MPTFSPAAQYFDVLARIVNRRYRLSVDGSGNLLIQTGKKNQRNDLTTLKSISTTPRLHTASFTVGAEAGNAIVVSIQLKDAGGNDLTTRANVYAYLSDDANGDSLIATAHDGAVAGGTDGVLQAMEAKKSFRLTSEADGDIDVSITHAAGAKTAYLVLVLPEGNLVVSGAITHA